MPIPGSCAMLSLLVHLQSAAPKRPGELKPGRGRGDKKLHPAHYSSPSSWNPNFSEVIEASRKFNFFSKLEIWQRHSSRSRASRSTASPTPEVGQALGNVFCKRALSYVRQ